MNHPDPEQWVAYLYDEVDSSTRSHLKSHLAGCESCRDQLAQWSSVQHRLNSPRLPTPMVRTVSWPMPRLLRWAAAALLMIAIGFTVGRSSGASPKDVAAMREELRGELAHMVNARLDQLNITALTAANEQTTATLREFANYYDAGLLSLRKDLETVALNSDVGLRQTRQQIIRLADYSQANPGIPPN